MAININEALILDDNPQSLDMMRRLATRCGYSAVGASSIKEFKTVYARSRPTVLILDVVVGEEDCTVALEFLAQCRCATPIVLVTGHAPQFLDVMEGQVRELGLKLAAKIEKRKSIYKLEDLLAELRIPEVD